MVGSSEVIALVRLPVVRIPVTHSFGSTAATGDDNRHATRPRLAQRADESEELFTRVKAGRSSATPQQLVPWADVRTVAAR